MPRLGAHLSIAGGLPRAVDRAEASGCEALQIFTKSAGQWRAREIPEEEIALFRRRVAQTTIGLNLDRLRRLMRRPARPAATSRPSTTRQSSRRRR